jgi:hypothetical protein
MLLPRVILHTIVIIITTDPIAKHAGQQSIGKFIANSTLGLRWQ